MRATERQRGSGHERPAWPGNAIERHSGNHVSDGLARARGGGEGVHARRRGRRPARCRPRRGRGGARRAVRRGRLVLRAFDDLARRRRATRRGPSSSPLTITAGRRRTRPGWEHHDPDIVDPDRRLHRHAAVVPPGAVRRRSRALRHRRRRRVARRRRPLEHASRPRVHRRRTRRRTGAGRLRRVGTERRRRRHPRHPRRVPRSRRRWPAAVRGHLPAGLASGQFELTSTTGSLRLLRRLR